MTRNEILEAACQFYRPETVTEREIAFARHMVKWALSEREWVSLTNEDIAEIERWVEFKEAANDRIQIPKLVLYIEKKIREKNHGTR